MKRFTLSILTVSIMMMIFAVSVQSVPVYAAGMFLAMIASFRAVCSG